MRRQFFSRQTRVDRSLLPYMKVGDEMLKAMYTSWMLTVLLHRNIPGSEHAGVGSRADKDDMNFPLC